MPLSFQAIKNHLPHRYPFLLIDRILEIALDEKITALKNVTFNEWFFPGHFPEEPIMPGVLIVEAMAQAGAILAFETAKQSHDPLKNPSIFFMSIAQGKFRKPVVPGDTLKLEVKKEQQRHNTWRFTGKSYVNETLVAEAQFSALVKDKAE